MVESTARRERSEPKSAPVATYLWEVPQKPVAARLAFDLIDRMEHEVIENFRSLTSRGSEIGGVLLGSFIAGTPLNVIVQDYEAIPCDYSRGPLYRLSDADLGRFERSIEQHAAPGLVVMGFFRAHSRKGLSLDAEDLAFLDARFREPHHIALLVRPFATKTSVGGLFIREDGAFRGEASYLEFPFRSSQLTPSLWTPPEAAPPPPAPSPVNPTASTPPAAKPGMRSQVVPIGLRRDAGSAAPASDAKPSVPPVTDRKTTETKPPAAPLKPPAAEAKTAPPARPPAAEPKPAAKEAKPGAALTKNAPPAKEAEPARPATPAPARTAPGLLSGDVPSESQGSRKIMMVLGGVAATVAALVLLFVYPGYLAHSRHTAAIESPAAELTLRVEPSGTDLLLTWNKNSAAVANASHGVLSINDGERHENYDMDPTQLTTGSIIYTPVSGDVSFRMEVTGKNQSKTLTESVRSLRTRPSPMPDGKSPANAASAKANQPQAQPAATPAGIAATTQAPNQPATTPAEVTPAVPAKAAPKAFNTESLTQRLRPASPAEIADANLAGAAPTSPAGVSVNPSLSMPFAAAPAPVAPAPPAAKKAAPVAGGKVAAAQLVYRKEPQYPTAARQMNVKGQVTVEATIGPDGRVTAVKIISGHPLLAQAAKQAVAEWRYKPALLDGQPVETNSQISLNFLGTH